MSLPPKARKFMTRYREQGLQSALIGAWSFVTNRACSRYESVVHPKVLKMRYRATYRGSYPAADKLIHVDPTEIDHVTFPNFTPRVPLEIPHVKEGDWDQNLSTECVMLTCHDQEITDTTLVELENYGLYRAFRAHFADGIPWRDTEFYQWALAGGVSPKTPVMYSRYGTKERMDTYFAKIDTLYDDIRSNGYLTQDEVGSKRNEATLHREYDYRSNDEICVNIGRDGAFFLDDGRHRFMITRVLGLDSIPVKVLVRHKQWQSRRQDIHQSTGIDELSPRCREVLSHPDMNDVVPPSLKP